MISRDRLKEIVREELRGIQQEDLGAMSGVWAAMGSRDMMEYNTSAAGLKVDSVGFESHIKWDSGQETSSTTKS